MFLLPYSCPNTRLILRQWSWDDIEKSSADIKKNMNESKMITTVVIISDV